MGTSVGLLIQNYLDTGNESYFEELVSTFQPLIKSYARKLYYLEYDDSVQELTLSLFEAVRKMKSTDDEYACISYINKSVVHKFCKLYYESMKEQKIQQNNISIDCNPNSDYAYGHEIEDCASFMDLCNRLKAISPVERKITCLLLEGYSDKEIGDQLGYSRQYVNRIKKKIFK